MRIIALLLVLFSVCFAQPDIFGPGGMPLNWGGLNYLEADSVYSARFSSLAATSYQYFASSAAADTLGWRQATATASDKDMVMKWIEEDGTVHNWLWDDGNSWWYAIGGLYSNASIGSGSYLTANGSQLYLSSTIIAAEPTIFKLESNTTGSGTVLIGETGDADITRVIGSFSTGLLNLVTSPDFAASTGWTLSNTTITGGKLNKLVAVGAGTAIQAVATMPIVSGITYQMRVDVDSLSTGHDIVVTMGGATVATIVAEGSNQWFRVTTVNATGPLTFTWATGETGIVDNVYVYEVPGKATLGGSVWNPVWTKTTSYTVLTGDNLLTFDCASDTLTCTLPTLASSWDALTSTGRSLSIKNIGAFPLIIDANAGEDIDAADTLRVAQWGNAVLQATPARWEIR